MLFERVKIRRERKRAQQAREKDLVEKSDAARVWFEQHMKPDEPADLTYEKEVLPKLTPINFAVENRELNAMQDPWVSATKKWFS